MAGLPRAPVGPPQAQRQMEAKRSFAKELFHWPIFCPDSQMKLRVRPAFGTEGSWSHAYSQTHVQEVTRSKAMLCDRRFRAMTTTAAHQQPPNGLPLEGKPPVRTPEFQCACASYRSPPQPDAVPGGEDDALGDPSFSIDIDDFLRQIGVYTVSEEAYGTTGDTLRMAHEIQHHHRTALNMTHFIIDEMRSKKAFGPQNIIHSEEDARTKIDNLLTATSAEKDTKARINQRLEARYIALKSARASWGLLTTRVNAHVRKRIERNDQFLTEVDDDTLDTIAQHLDLAADTCSLMRTCKRFATYEGLRLKLPNLRIRPVMGSFPHYREVSRDRAALARGVKKQEVRQFVLNRKVVHLYVDFCMTQRRKEPLKKKERKDGLSNLERDLSDDEYEDPPDARVRRAPLRRQNPHIPPTLAFANDPAQTYNRFESAEDNRRERWDRLEGPEEKIDRHAVQQRLPYQMYFAEALKCGVELVYADTHDPVPSPDYKGGIVPSNILSRDELVFRQPRQDDFPHLPAQAKFHIKELSAAHDNRLFKLKVTGRGKFNKKSGGGDATLVVYTAPFEVNSRESVVKGGRVRRTAGEVAQQRAENVKRVKSDR